MLSRVAESIYWMSRYTERAENVARFIEVNLHQMLDQPSIVNGQWEPLVTVTGDHETFAKRYGKATRENVIRFLTFDPEYPSSIYSCLCSARENARSIREVISSEMWEQINKFYLMVRDASTKALNGNINQFYESVRMASLLFQGITDATLSHGEGWQFYRLGLLLERADKSSRILDVKYFVLLPHTEDVGTPLDSVQWAALLKSASALEMYRKRFHTITPAHVADFLVLDRDFPRAIQYCILRAEQAVHAVSGGYPEMGGLSGGSGVSGGSAGAFSNAAEQRLGRLRSELAYTRISEIISQGLHEYLDAFQTKLNQVDDAIFQTFFALRPVETGQKMVQRQLQLQ